MSPRFKVGDICLIPIPHPVYFKEEAYAFGIILDVYPSIISKNPSDKVYYYYNIFQLYDKKEMHRKLEHLLAKTDPIYIRGLKADGKLFC